MPTRARPGTRLKVRARSVVSAGGGALWCALLACTGASGAAGAGVTSADCSKAAIAADCAGPVGAYTACTSAQPACGSAGQPCCTASAYPCMGGCCDPGTQMCVGEFQPCSTPGERCSEPSCTACGSPGQPCCKTSCANGCCNPQGVDAGMTCVAAGDSCTNSGLPGICTYSPAVQVTGSCSWCGGPSEPCCTGNVCETGLTCSGTMCG
jgi:hypothetical protein